MASQRAEGSEFLYDFGERLILESKWEESQGCL